MVPTPRQGNDDNKDKDDGNGCTVPEYSPKLNQSLRLEHLGVRRASSLKSLYSRLGARGIVVGSRAASAA